MMQPMKSFRLESKKYCFFALRRMAKLILLHHSEDLKPVTKDKLVAIRDFKRQSSHNLKETIEIFNIVYVYLLENLELD